MAAGAAGAAVIATPVKADQLDAEIVTAGRKFQELFALYMPAWFQWARLAREARAETEAKFGDDYSSPAWSRPLPGQSPAAKFLSATLDRNDARVASNAVDALHQQMDPIAQFIRDEEIESLAGLRAKALVAMWDSRPDCAIHDGCLNFEDEWSLHSLMTGVVAVTGLSDLFGAFVERIEGDATKPIKV